MTISKLVSSTVIIILLVLLVLVRLFEIPLFNDPLYAYFHSDFQLYDLPDIDLWSVIASTSLRFLLNMVLSIWILWFLYKRESYIRASLWVYLFAFILLLIAFILLIDADSNFMKMALFYARRFLIQPILLFILVPGFYFLKNKGNKLV
ncbi:exosortase F system-associated protein [Nonlabens mediterrranea]|uniref:Exosortase F system-associated protein n=1 Tax=Nonlabens mediterrranea TaxID=1419947 RepID=A0ABS0A8S9_9FLAO|nr:exosortase F system-associated protein [Nonlabens mediterrranea]